MQRKTMKPSSDKEFERYKDVNFANAKRVKDTPHLLKWQASMGAIVRTPFQSGNAIPADLKEQAN